MTPRSHSPPLITGIDGIISRPPNKVNYSILNGKNMETGKQPENEIRRKYRKFGISGNIERYVKQEENARNSLMEPGNQNKIEVMKTNVEDNGEEDGVTRETRQQKCKNLTPNTEAKAFIAKIASRLQTNKA